MDDKNLFNIIGENNVDERRRGTNNSVLYHFTSIDKLRSILFGKKGVATIKGFEPNVNDYGDLERMSQMMGMYFTKYISFTRNPNSDSGYPLAIRGVKGNKGGQKDRVRITLDGNFANGKIIKPYNYFQNNSSLQQSEERMYLTNENDDCGNILPFIRQIDIFGTTSTQGQLAFTIRHILDSADKVQLPNGEPLSSIIFVQSSRKDFNAPMFNPAISAAAEKKGIVPNNINKALRSKEFDNPDKMREKQLPFFLKKYIAYCIYGLLWVKHKYGNSRINEGQYLREIENELLEHIHFNIDEVNNFFGRIFSHIYNDNNVNDENAVKWEKETRKIFEGLKLVNVAAAFDNASIHLENFSKYGFEGVISEIYALGKEVGVICVRNRPFLRDIVRKIKESYTSARELIGNVNKKHNEDIKIKRNARADVKKKIDAEKEIKRAEREKRRAEKAEMLKNRTHNGRGRKATVIPSLSFKGDVYNNMTINQIVDAVHQKFPNMNVSTIKQYLYTAARKQSIPTNESDMHYMLEGVLKSILKEILD